MRLSIFIITSLTLPALAASNATKSALTTSPEEELSTISSQLDNLKLKLAAAADLSRNPGITPAPHIYTDILAKSREYFKLQEWASSIYYANEYASKIQIPNVGEYLECQYILGRSYAELGNFKEALNAYLRYLKGYLTDKSGDPVILSDVMTRIPDVLQKSTNSRSKAVELLSTLLTVSLPEELKPEVKLLTAKVALKVGELKTALMAVEQVLTEAKYQNLKAKAHYLKALIHHQEKRADLAEEAFQLALSSAEDDTIKDLSHLGLARILSQQNRRELSLEHYAKISDTSKVFKDALFESTYVAMSIKNYTLGRDKATLFLARFPEGLDAVEIRTIIAYLDMKAGDLARAAAAINAADQSLKTIDNWVIKELSSNAEITQSDLANLQKVLGSQVPLPIHAEQGIDIFMRLGEVKNKLQNGIGTIHNLTFTMGRASTWQLNPRWENRTSQVTAISRELLELGHKLAASERNLYRDDLDPITLQKLQASEDRRIRLLSPAASRKRNNQKWQNQVAYDDATRKLAEVTDRITYSEAETTGTTFLAEKYSPNMLKELSQIKSQTHDLKLRLKSVLDKLRTNRMLDNALQASHHATHKEFAQYAAALLDDNQTFKALRDKRTSGVYRLNADQAAVNWEKWEVLAGETFKVLAEIDTDITKDLKNRVEILAVLKSEYLELNTTSQSLTATTEQTIGNASSYIAEQIRVSLEDRLAKNRKWLGDIDWLTFKAKENEEEKLSKAFELEKQILNDHLLDLKQGALWQWPN